MPPTDKPYDGYFNASPECWSVFTEVVGAEFANVVLFSQVHQLTVDAYATQHAGGPHPDKSIAIHLAGLHFHYAQGVKPTSIAPLLQQLATRVSEWPHFDPPPVRGSMTVFDVALAESHIDAVRDWSRGVWEARGRRITRPLLSWWETTCEHQLSQVKCCATLRGRCGSSRSSSALHSSRVAS
jgi:Family of unknown function (DUF5946)